MFGVIIALWLFTLVVGDVIVGKLAEARGEDYKHDTGTRILLWVGWTFFYFMLVFKFI